MSLFVESAFIYVIIDRSVCVSWSALNFKRIYILIVKVTIEKNLLPWPWMWTRLTHTRAVTMIAEWLHIQWQGNKKKLVYEHFLCSRFIGASCMDVRRNVERDMQSDLQGEMSMVSYFLFNSLFKACFHPLVMKKSSFSVNTMHRGEYCEFVTDWIHTHSEVFPRLIS